MTKADIVSNISDQLGIDRADVQATVEKFMKEAGFIKKEELEPLKRRISELENQISKLQS
jgi:polyhydroxyalkanoate synthesis regulator phasin